MIKKITVALAEELAGEVRVAARKAAVSVSEFVAAAIENELRRRRGLEFLADWQAEHGEFTIEEIAAARAEMTAADAEWLGLRSRTRA